MSEEKTTPSHAPHWIIVILLLVLIGHQAFTEWRGRHAPAGTAQAVPETQFSVTTVGDFQYVMRINQNIFYCVSNKCTTIQDVSQALAAAAAARRAGSQDNGENED